MFVHEAYVHITLHVCADTLVKNYDYVHIYVHTEAATYTAVAGVIV